MADLWLPGFAVHKLKAGGTYDDTTNPKLGWHTWEGLSWAAAETAFRSYPPHIGCKPPHPGVPAREVGKRQYVPLNRHAYSFAGSESDDEYVIQVEVAGRAAEAADWTDQVCEWLATEIVAPLEKAVGIPPIIVSGGFYDTTNYRPKVGTNYLGSSRSEIRLTAGQLRAFSGHLGHQHMPPPDTHWDPGRLPIDRILSHPTEGFMAALTDKQQQQLYDRIMSLVPNLPRNVATTGPDVGSVSAAGTPAAELWRWQLEVLNGIRVLLARNTAGLDTAQVAAAIVDGMDDELKNAVKAALREGTD